MNTLTDSGMKLPAKVFIGALLGTPILLGGSGR
jgi:hypothetical protein